MGSLNQTWPTMMGWLVVEDPVPRICKVNLDHYPISSVGNWTLFDTTSHNISMAPRGCLPKTVDLNRMAMSIGEKHWQKTHHGIFGYPNFIPPKKTYLWKGRLKHIKDHQRIFRALESHGRRVLVGDPVEVLPKLGPLKLRPAGSYMWVSVSS